MKSNLGYPDCCGLRLIVQVIRALLENMNTNKTRMNTNKECLTGFEFLSMCNPSIQAVAFLSIFIDLNLKGQLK